ncbi:hypothetical protein GGP79_001103 [Salinibacter ruber]|uniref:hypothetical protein n=1 Tax=Salinibacter ruber TaxID=146919 RepID=UPI00216A9FAC|nr:hypothetical protein [Salinibacter ruber]MCS3753158.1 hypothetical protein [Salinibacter ruber]
MDIKILFICPKQEDFLSDSLLHGLRKIYSNNVIDWPKNRYIYKNSEYDDIHGGGFTIYNTLDDIEIEREDVKSRAKKNYFDLVILAKIHNQSDFIIRNYGWLTQTNLVILDTADQDNIYPYSTNDLKKGYTFLFKNLYKQFPYFKREITNYSYFSAKFGFLPVSLTKMIDNLSIKGNKKLLNNLENISFSIPKSKVLESPSKKDKLFTRHIVDREVAARVEGSTAEKVFKDEDEYFDDIQSSKFGVTMKRSGWDCLRHYEIAANAAVPCFKRLSDKPKRCPPYGLGPDNCIYYSNFDELMHKVNELDHVDYICMQKNALEWAKENTTVKRAKLFLHKCQKYYDL